MSNRERATAENGAVRDIKRHASDGYILSRAGIENKVDSADRQDFIRSVDNASHGDRNRLQDRAVLVVDVDGCVGDGHRAATFGEGTLEIFACSGPV